MTEKTWRTLFAATWEKEGFKMAYNPATVSAIEQSRFIALRDIVGQETAVYIMCAYHNILFDPEITKLEWAKYVKTVEKRGDPRFSEGQTALKVAPKQNPETKQEEWERVWGLGSEDHPYTIFDYRRMDQIFNTMTARRRATGGFDDQQEDVFRFCARTAHQRDKLMALGDKDSIASAQKLDKMIQDNLAAENLRKRDEAPEQTARVDGIVEAIQKKFGKGITLNFDDTMEMIGKWMHETGRYNITQDAAEQSLMFIVNNMRMNSDMPQITELPEDGRLDAYAKEFNPRAEQREKEVYDHLQLVRRQK